MATMAQISDREQRLREALRRGLCTEHDTVGTCLERLAAHDRLAALAPELLRFVRAVAVQPGGQASALLWRERLALADEARALLGRVEGGAT